MNQEAEWIERCRRGENEAFAGLYEKYIRGIYDFAYFKTFHKETAEDVAATVFMKAFEHIGRFDPRRGPFGAWLFRIARNEVIDVYRRRLPALSLDDVWDLPAGGDVEVDAVNRDHYRRVRDYLGRLPAEKRDLLIMRIWLDLPFKEIAGALEQNEAQCKMMFYRALDKLRQEVPVTIFIALAVCKHVIR